MFKTIVWATDGSDFADRALPYATSLADGPGKKLVAVHAKELMVGRAGGYPAIADEEDVETRIRRRVAEIREHGVEASFRLVSGTAPHAAHLIAQVAGEVGADVIVVGTRGYTPVAGVMLGSVTQRLLHLAPCPVLAVPDRHGHDAPKNGREEVAAAR